MTVVEPFGSLPALSLVETARATDSPHPLWPGGPRWREIAVEAGEWNIDDEFLEVYLDAATRAGEVEAWPVPAARRKAWSYYSAWSDCWTSNVWTDEAAWCCSVQGFATHCAVAESAGVPGFDREIYVELSTNDAKGNE